jgi:hypothetical protein
VDVVELAEVALAEPEQDRPGELGVSVDVVVLLGAELLAVVGVGPLPGVVVAALQPEHLGTPVLWFAGQDVAPFQQQAPLAGGSQRPGQRAAARPGPDHDDVVVLGHGRSFPAASRVTGSHARAAGATHRVLYAAEVPGTAGT